MRPVLFNFSVGFFLLTSAAMADLASTNYIHKQINDITPEHINAENKQNKNEANGYAGLDENGKIDPGQIVTDPTPTQDSNNMVNSGAVWSAINSAWNEYY